MEDLFAQFSFLSDQALRDKHFDPSSIEDLTNLFELEAYNAWAAMELACSREVEDSHDSFRKVEKDLESEVESAMDEYDSAIESAMEEYRRFEEEMEATAAAELSSLELLGDAARKLGSSLEKAATAASKKYAEASMSSAVASMRSAWRNLASPKVHPA